MYGILGDSQLDQLSNSSHRVIHMVILDTTSMSTGASAESMINTTKHIGTTWEVGNDNSILSQVRLIYASNEQNMPSLGR